MLTNIRRGTVSLSLLVLLGGGLAACGTSSSDLTASVSKTSCSDVNETLAAISAADDKKGGARKSAFRELELKDNPSSIKFSLDGLREKAKSDNCKNGEATDSPDPVDEFVIDMPKRTGDRLNADGVPDDIRGDGEKVRTFIAEQAKRDPLTLFNYYMSSPLGDSDPLKNETVLAKDGNVKDGNVFSKKGVETYNRWVAIWNNPDITSIKAVKEITFQGANTGATDDNKPTQDPTGVRGKDKSGYDVAYKDAGGKVVKEHSVLNRCTQTTTKTPHKGIPKGPTDNPRPPKDTPPTTPKPCVEIPGNGVYDCGNPKSSNPRDYVYPSGKPKVTSGPSRSTPHPVETKKPGGGGVVDTPTNKPGSESGVTAPGATPAPTTPRPTNPPEGGSGGSNTNDGSAGGPP